MLIILLLLIIAVIAYSYGINRFLGYPPGPAPLPIIGNMLSFQWDMDKLFLEWKEKYGRIFTVWLPFPVVVIGDHKILQEQVVRNGEAFLAKNNPEEMVTMVSGGLYGLVFEDNSMVKEQRKFALKTLHEIGFGSAALEDIVHNYALEIVSRWKNTGEKAVDVTENIMRAVGNIIWNIAFGLTLEFDNPLLIDFRKLLQEFIDRSAGPLMMFIEIFPWLKHFDFLFGNSLEYFKENSKQQNAYLQKGIDTATNSFNPDNTSSCYVEAFLAEIRRREDSGKEIGNFHNLQLLGSVGSLWGAGFDTTVGILRMCVLELVNHPSVQKKVQEEIDRLGDRRILSEDHKQLPYTCAFLQEVYRLANVLPMNFQRKTTSVTEIEGFTLPIGTSVLPQFSMVHMDPKEFERPEYFCPERHLNEEGQFVKDARITPFSIGKRACLGETLARMEIFVMLSTFVQHCNFKPVGKVPPEIKFISGFSRSVDNFLVKIEPRN